MRTIVFAHLEYWTTMMDATPTASSTSIATAASILSIMAVTDQNRHFLISNIPSLIQFGHVLPSVANLVLVMARTAKHAITDCNGGRLRAHTSERQRMEIPRKSSSLARLRVMRNSQIADLLGDNVRPTFGGICPEMAGFSSWTVELTRWCQ